MDCKNVRLLLEVAHPLATELDARDTAELASHLADCPNCGPWAEAEYCVDDHIGKAMLAVPVPDGLAQNLLCRLHVQRDAWYRGWAVRTAGVAATLLLAAWLGWAMWWNKKPLPDLDAFCVHADTFLYKADQVESSFAALGVTVTVPPNFDYAYLASHRLIDFQGKHVPYLLFFHPTKAAMAEVYVLSDRQFNIEDFKETMRSGSRKNFKILTCPNVPNVKYLVVYPVSMQDFDMFIKPRRNADA